MQNNINDKVIHQKFNNMKKYSSFLICYVIFISSFLFPMQKAYCQENFIGTWEGVFMNDFDVRINFDGNNQGNIKMIAGGNIIQNDQITDIKLTHNEFTFYIPDKQTPFIGNFNDQITHLTGEFIFPDGKKYAIQLKRKIDDTNPSEEFKATKEIKFKAEDLHADLLFLNSSLKEHHPQLYAFTSTDSMEIILKRLNSELIDDFTLEKSYLILSQLTDAVKCSHTGIRLPLSYQNLANNFGNYFPFRLYFKNERAFIISGNFEGNLQISPGNEIISINNMPVKKIIEQLFFLIPSEGCNVTTKYNELNKRFNALFYFLDDSEKFIVKYKKGTSTDSITVSSSRLESIKSLDGAIEDNRLISFNYIDNMTFGVLKVPSFAIPDMDHYFQQLDSIFNDLKTTNTQNLILDLRDNSGGHPIFAAQLFSYLTEKDFIYFKRNDEVKEFEPLYNVMQPNRLNFRGNIYVFVNGGCLSTTGHLISLLKFNTNAIFIGEEPGSTFRCNDFSMQLHLPNTGIELNVPRVTFETSVTGFTLCHPFPIDYEVNNPVIKIINKEDAFLEMVRLIIDK